MSWGWVGAGGFPGDFVYEYMVRSVENPAEVRLYLCSLSVVFMVNNTDEP